MLHNTKKCSRKKVGVTLESPVKKIDEIREEISVERGRLIKGWLQERVGQEKGLSGTE